MTAEWLHLPPPYPPGVGPLCGAELEAWYEDLQDILGSDAGGAKLARPPPCSEKEPEFLDVLESCSLTWLTDGQGWGEGVQRVMEDPPPQLPTHAPVPCLSPPAQEEERRGGEGQGSGSGSGGDLLPPEFFELLSEGGVGLVETGAMLVSGAGIGYHHQLPRCQLPSPAHSEEEPPTVPCSPSYCSSSSSSSCASQSPVRLGHSPPSSPQSPPPPPPPASTAFLGSPRPGKRKRAVSPGSSSSSSSPNKKSRREREQENERRVQELTDQNERLKSEIERLGEEVQRTRRSLIERLVNTRK
ncbi:DNA damage-inducible transcript 3 protein isoform X1 [Clupea harengus]|uniref:DNA damage-inducible transcript 3 protein n=1 Tax=Clupea harengus TaxID=7950 RepID=A0A6P8FII6_CLUHA|nr:DNA damage-inducible transcript 3 protein isoform X1 [Clupea harengus]